MKQFSLDKYLENTSRKVVTRDGKQVRIVCWDSPNKGFPIVGFIDDNPTVFIWDKYGYALPGHRESNCDLFFADKEEELTEFEEKVINIVFKYKYWNNSKDEVKQYIQNDSKELLDLARKEIRKEEQEKLGTLGMPIDVTDPYYIQGKQDALKDLPKWKKANVFVSNEFGLATRDDDLIITCNGYQIKLSDLKALPKEE